MNICVFCGSSEGAKTSYMQAAHDLGAELAQRKIGLVYGGASIGLMGATADAALRAGGTVIGVIPESLAELEIAHQNLTELHVVNSMHERKALMANRADAFIALPGGIGTLEETFEVWTWNQLGLHRKPLGLLNIDGYYDQLLAFLDHQVAEGFVKIAHRKIMCTSDNPQELIDQLETVKLPTIPKIL